MDQRAKIFIACGLGGGLGTLVALSVAQHFWWLGLIVGFGAGYLSYEFKQVCSAVKQAWKTVIGWRPDKELWKIRLEVYVWAVMAGITFTFFGACLIFLTSGLKKEELSVIFIVCFIIFEAYVSLVYLVFLIDTSRNRQFKYLKRMKHTFKKCNPFTVCFYYLPKGIWWVIRHAPQATVGLIRFLKKGIILFARFIRTVFVLIHSDRRLLCGFDAGIGAGIGYFAGSVIVGILAGGIIGVLNYEILSKRLLRLVPVKK